MRKPIEKLFVKKHPDDLRSEAILIRLTKQEMAQIEKAAKWRYVGKSTFVRNAALGKKTDVDYETAIATALLDVNRSIKQLYAGYVARGMAPPVNVLEPALDAVVEAARRIYK